MLERKCQLNTGLKPCGEEQPICPIPRRDVKILPQYRYYARTNVPLRNIETGKLEPPTLVIVDHISDPIWDLWDVPLDEIKRNRAQVEARNLIQMQVKKKPHVVIQFPSQGSHKVETRELLLSKRA
jgi:hypothetical protein